MWTETTREQYRRDGLRYASDMTDAEWAMVEPFMPAVKRLGRPRKVDLRGVVEGLLYLPVAPVAARFSKPLDGAALLL
jgi:putative transposase